MSSLTSKPAGSIRTFTSPVGLPVLTWEGKLPDQTIVYLLEVASSFCFLTLCTCRYIWSHAARQGRLTRPSELDNVFLDKQNSWFCWLACTHMRPKAPPTGLLKMAKGGFRGPGPTISSSKSCIQFCILCGQTWHHVRSHAAKDWAWQCFPWKENQLVLSGPLLVSLPGPKAGPAGLSKKARTVSEGKI